MHLYFIFFVPDKGEMNPKTFGYIKNVFDNLFSNIKIPVSSPDAVEGVMLLIINSDINIRRYRYRNRNKRVWEPCFKEGIIQEHGVCLQDTKHNLERTLQ